ncbi:MAG: hypothetical protein WC700_04270 [Gemmatimonadaceae bacterium]|jgi:hypothetical protein
MNNLLIAAVVVVLVAIAAFFAFRQPNCKTKCPCPPSGYSDKFVMNLTVAAINCASDVTSAAHGWWVDILSNSGMTTAAVAADPVAQSMKAYVNKSALLINSVSDAATALNVLDVLFRMLYQVGLDWNSEILSLTSSGKISEDLLPSLRVIQGNVYSASILLQQFSQHF